MKKRKGYVGGDDSTGTLGSMSKCKEEISLEEKDSVRKSQPDFNQIEEMVDSDWEDGFVPISNSIRDDPVDPVKGLTIEFDTPPDSSTQKRTRRASAKDKDLAELIHKVHLLCLIARGRLVDKACDDPLLKASLLSLVPIDLLNISKVSKLTANDLAPLVCWFHSNFHTRIPRDEEKSFHSALFMALQTYEGTPEEIIALSVALFRALNLTTRFVSILDVTSLKPGTDKFESQNQDASRAAMGVFKSSTPMVTAPKMVGMSPAQQSSCSKTENTDQASVGVAQRKVCNDSLSKAPRATRRSVKRNLDSEACEAETNTSEAVHTPIQENLTRKGDLEFEMQLQMAVSATSVGVRKNDVSSDVKVVNIDSSKVSTLLKRLKGIQSDESPTSSRGVSTAFGSRKVGAPLYWAEVYCSGENLTGKWVHCDAVNLIIDGAQRVEAEAAACKTSLRYAVAFAGNGAKDVTRRYCMKWYKIASQRINSVWWKAVLAPLKDLESRATEGIVNLEKHPTTASNQNDEVAASASRRSLEDMELETRALTEPLPTNQQAYKNHPLYAIEKWLTKYQILHPKGPILGFCSGHSVYPRDCVQTLKTKERWLREAMQVKANELPVKVLKLPQKPNKVQIFEDYNSEEPASESNISLYGMWQLEPLCLPRAMNGIVPRNERGQVDVWSEKCLPPGTVHLRLPRLVPVVNRLGVNFAPAMVGFEFRNGRSLPVFEGLVVCAEFKDAILQAYAEEEERRTAELKKRNEREAISRWYQLLSSIVTRQRLKNSYGDVSSSQIPSEIPITADKKLEEKVTSSSRSKDENPQKTKFYASSTLREENHEHVFLTEDQSYDEESSTRTKRCRCGFAVRVEEL